MSKARDNYGKALAFVEFALTQATDECILWPFTKNRGGYPNVGHGTPVNRVICERTYGPPPERAHAAHSCHVKLCVNPSHLRWASPHENARDNVARGVQVRGERVGRAKLTAAEVEAIRASTEHYKALAQRYGISTGYLYALRRRENWRHL